MGQTALRKCTCKNEYQDKMYGAGNRLHNMCKKTANSVSWRCTVCGKMT